MIYAGTPLEPNATATAAPAHENQFIRLRALDSAPELWRQLNRKKEHDRPSKTCRTRRWTYTTSSINHYLLSGAMEMCIHSEPPMET